MSIAKKHKASVFVPKLILSDVTRLTADTLVSNGIKGLILDVDNTLTSHGSQLVAEHISDWLDEMKKNKIPMIIVSNNTKKRITPFAKLLGLPFISMGLKPLVRGFKAAAARLELKPNEIAIVGDQIFTDILGGNRAKMFTVLVKPILLEKSFSFRIRRKIEKRFISRYSEEKI